MGNIIFFYKTSPAILWDKTILQIKWVVYNKTFIRMLLAQKQVSCI